jgi:hypothetical protein
MDEFIQENFRGRKSVTFKVVNIETGEERFVNTETGTGPLSENETIVFPLGHADSNGDQLYQGDMSIVEISNKYGNFYKCGVVRTEGFFAAGLDYLNRDNRIDEAGDFIDDPYIERIIRLENVIKINLESEFDWESLAPGEDEEG